MVDKIKLSDVLTTISKLSHDINNIILTANIQSVPVMDLISGIYNNANLSTNNIAITNLDVSNVYKNKAGKLVQNYIISLLVDAPSNDDLPLCYVANVLVDINIGIIVDVSISFNIVNNDWFGNNVNFNCDNIKNFTLPNNFSLDLNIKGGYVLVYCDKLDVED